jgi:hypothetical protein
MFDRALWSMQWRQLGSLRWGGLATAAGLVPLMWLFATLAQSGTPLLSGWNGLNAREGFTTIVPVFLMLVVWPLVSLALVTQAFGADLSRGHDLFLWVRPISRAAVWWSRLFASLASLTTVVGGSIAAWFLLSLLTDQVTRSQRLSALETMALVSVLTIPAALSAGALVASTGISGIAALLLAVAIGALSSGAGVVAFAWGSAFKTELGMGAFAATCLLLWGVCLRASYRAAVVGEPLTTAAARTKRCAWTFAAWLIPILVLVVVGIPAGARWLSGHPQRGYLSSFGDRGGSTALGVLQTKLGGWLVDLKTAKTIRYLPAIDVNFAADPATGRLAVLSRGSIWRPKSLTQSLSFYDAAGERVGSTLEIEASDLYPQIVHWNGDRVLIVVPRPEGQRTYLIPFGATSLPDPIVRDARPEWIYRYHTPTQQLFVRREGDRWHRVDLDHGVIEEPTLFVDENTVWLRFMRRMSPDGRRYVTFNDRPTPTAELFDLRDRTSKQLDLPENCLPIGWTSRGDLALECRKTGTSQLVLQSPDGSRTDALSDATVGAYWLTSPSNRYLWILRSPMAGEPSIFDTETGRSITDVDGRSYDVEFWVSAQDFVVWRNDRLELVNVERGVVGPWR